MLLLVAVWSVYIPVQAVCLGYRAVPPAELREVLCLATARVAWPVMRGACCADFCFVLFAPDLMSATGSSCCLLSSSAVSTYCCCFVTGPTQRRIARAVFRGDGAFDAARDARVSHEMEAVIDLNI